MSDPSTLSKLTEIDVGIKAFAIPVVAAETQKFGADDRSNPSPVTVASGFKALEDCSSFTELKTRCLGEPPLYVASPIHTERPKAGLTKTKRNLKKQLQIKMAALDDSHQSQSLPSPNLSVEEAKAGSANAVRNTVHPGSETVARVVASSDSAEKCEISRPNEELALPVTVKVEAPDAECLPSSGTDTGPTRSDAADKTAVPEDIYPSSNETISQSGTEVAGPTKWIIGDMLWARVSGHPWWPCMVAYDPTHTAFTRTLKRRQGSLVQYHVQFFGDEGERGWINECAIIPFEGLQAFTEFCNKMMALHKKDRQNYIVPARRLKAWNVAVKSAEEAFPMTRVFRVHRFAFVYQQPVVANGSVNVADAQQSKKGVKRSRSSSVGGSGEGQPKKRRRIGEKKAGTSPVSPLATSFCFTPGFRPSDQHVTASDGMSPETGATVFRSRAEGVKRSSRFVKPTYRIMEHLEEVQQRRRIKLRPHRKTSGYDETAESEALASVHGSNPAASSADEKASAANESNQNSFIGADVETTKEADSSGTIENSDGNVGGFDSPEQMETTEAAETPSNMRFPSQAPDEGLRANGSCADVTDSNLNAVVKTEADEMAAGNFSMTSQPEPQGSGLYRTQSREEGRLNDEQERQEEANVTRTPEEACVKKAQDMVSVKRPQEEASVKSTQDKVSVKRSQEEVGVKSTQDKASVKRPQEEASVKKAQDKVSMKRPQEEAGVKHPQEEANVKRMQDGAKVKRTRDEVNVSHKKSSLQSHLNQPKLLRENTELSHRLQSNQIELSHQEKPPIEATILSHNHGKMQLSQQLNSQEELNRQLNPQVEIHLNHQLKPQEELNISHHQNSQKSADLSLGERTTPIAACVNDSRQFEPVPTFHVSEPDAIGLDVATAKQFTSLKKRQKRTFAANKDSVGKLRSSKKEEKSTNLTVELKEADVKQVTDGHVDAASSMELSKVEPASSKSPSAKCRKPPGRRKSAATLTPKVSEDVSDCALQQASPTNADGILTSSLLRSRLRSGPQFQPEFQNLGSLGPQKAEEVCHICEQSGEKLIECQGPCFGSYHLSCLGLTVSPVGSFRCDECSTGNHPCFVCKHTSRDTVACSASKCGRFYHRDCLGKFPLCKLDSTSVTCPLHTCTTCAAESGKNGRASKGLMYRCIRCPTAYHANDFCIAAGTVVIAGYNIICNSHLLSTKSPKKGVSHVNATWCFACFKDGSSSLVLCSSCPAAFHPGCIKLSQATSNSWQCKDCVMGKRPLYGEVVWAKVGNYRWWPAEVCHSKNLNVDNVNKAGLFNVRLFGIGFQFWLQQGRVFPFHDRDSPIHEPLYRTVSDKFEKAISEATEVYRLRLMARDARMNSEREKNEQKPAYYKHVKTNIPLGDVEIYKMAPSELPSCHCSPTAENPCGPDSDCINRLMMYECNAAVCPAGELCQNQRFQKREDADIRPYKTELRGWGLRCRADVKKGQFVAEYVGDLVDPEECNRRLEFAQQHNITNFYMLTLDKNRIIDAGPKGNYSRFMNHSCEPNCETQKWTVNGDIRVGLFALHDVPAGSELTFNYNLDCFGNQKTVCKCGSSICSGFLGVRPKTAAAVNMEKKSREAKLKKQLKEIKSKDKRNACFVCKKKGSELVACDDSKCEKFYHAKCLKPSYPASGKFICPLHKCESCAADSSKTCSFCPRSFCQPHFAGNIFSISDGSLVCSNHPDILDSCPLGRLNDSSAEATDAESNGVSLASNSLGKQSSDAVESNPQNVGKPSHRSTEVGKPSKAAKKLQQTTLVESGLGVCPESGPKKRGRPAKKIPNGQAKDDGMVVTASPSIEVSEPVAQTPKGPPNRRPKGQTPSGETQNSGSAKVRRKRKASNAGDDKLKLGKETLVVPLVKIPRLSETLSSSLGSGYSIGDLESAKVGKLRIGGDDSIMDVDVSREQVKVDRTEEHFSPLVLEDSF